MEGTSQTDWTMLCDLKFNHRVQHMLSFLLRSLFLIYIPGVHSTGDPLTCLSWDSAINGPIPHILTLFCKWARIPKNCCSIPNQTHLLFSDNQKQKQATKTKFSPISTSKLYLDTGSFHAMLADSAENIWLIEFQPITKIKNKKVQKIY